MAALLASSAGAANDETGKCRRAKLQASGTLVRSLLRCERRTLMHRSDPLCSLKAEAKLTAAFARAEAEGGCTTSGDARAIGALATASARRARATAEEEPLPCANTRLTAVGTYAQRVLRARATAVVRPDEVRLAATRARAYAALRRGLADAGCRTAPDSHALGIETLTAVGELARALSCGDGVREGGEMCDGADDAACPGACQNDCQCAPAVSITCLSPGVPVTALAGTFATQFEDSDLPAGAGLDATRASFVASPSNLYPILLGGEAGACIGGGTVHGEYDRSLDWETMHDLNNAGIRFENERFTVEGLRVDNVTDGIRPVGDEFTVRQAWLSYVRDDCIENDRLRSGTVEDSLLDGCYVAFSERRSANEGFDGRNEVLTVRGSLIRLQPMPGPREGDLGGLGHGRFFKWDPMATLLALHDNVFMAEQVGQSGADSMGVPDTLRDCSNNLMVWLGPGPYPAPLPGCFTVTTDASVWHEAVADWKLRHPHVGGAS